MDLRFAKWEVRLGAFTCLVGVVPEARLTTYLFRIQNGKQGDVKSLGEANQEAMAASAESK
jgi:hypothetical protein